MVGVAATDCFQFLQASDLILGFSLSLSLSLSLGFSDSAANGCLQGPQWDKAKQLPDSLHHQHAVLFLHPGTDCSHLQFSGIIK